MRGRLAPAGLALAVALAVAGFAPGVPAETPGSPKVVYLVSHGWHVGLVVRRDDLLSLSPPSRLPAPPTEHVEIGWGDADFYPAPEGTLSLALRAVFCSRGSVLHVAGFDGPVSRMFPGQDVVTLELTPAGFAALARHVDDSVAIADGHATAVAPPLYGRGAFYLARGRYRLLDNSNTWAARALKVAGCPIDVETTITAGGVLQQAARGRCGEPG